MFLLMILFLFVNFIYQFIFYFIFFPPFNDEMFRVIMIYFFLGFGTTPLIYLFVVTSDYQNDIRETCEILKFKIKKTLMMNR